MKKVLLILSGIVAVILIAAIVLPIIFKDDIKQAIDQEIASSVDAEIYFDTEDFSLTFFRNFPHVTASLENFGVAGKGVFAGDTLMSVDAFRVVINLGSVLFGDQIKINRVELNKPRIMVMVLEDGTANYDIMIDSGEAEQEPAPEEATEFSVGIDSWSVTDGQIVYYDQASDMLAEIRGLNHEGTGDFTQDVFDMSTFTQIQALSFSMEDVNYMSEKQVEADVTLEMNLPESKYTFKENTFKVNDFAFGFDGFLTMPAEAINMDLQFASRENTFKSLFSLIPGVFVEGYEDIKADGTLQFDGFVKGTYDEATEQMPAFNLNLLVNDATVQYPDLPSAIRNINMDLLVNNEDGVINNTTINLKKFHLDFGNNPVDAQLLVEGLEKMKIDANVDATIDLAEMNSMIPMEGLTLKGLYTANLKANGVYDSATSQFPQVNAKMQLADGFVKTSEFPSTIEDMSFNATVNNENGEMTETLIKVNDFNMLMDGEQFSANMILQNLENYTWDLWAKGTLDLEKLAQMAELEDMTLKGKILADINTKGQMSEVDAERYENLPTSGSVEVSNFYFNSEDLPQGFSINQASATFDPDKMNINSFDGSLGKSSIKANGYIANYIGYALKENETIKGQMNLTSPQFDVNEWMTDTDTTQLEEADTAELEVVAIPRNIDFILNSRIDQVLYDNLTLNDLRGIITIRDGIVSMDDVNFNALDGSFSMTGTYNTQDIENPLFSFDFNINDLSVSQAYQNFNTVKAMAPIAEKVNGKFSTNFKLAGALEPNMMPDYNSLVGQGLVEIVNAAVQDSKLISGLTNLTKLNDTDEVTMDDVKFNAEIKNGRIFVDPFDFKLGNINSTVYGSNGIDGSLDYIVKLNIPAGAVGEAINQAIASLGGQTGGSSSNIIMNVKVGGTYEDPDFGLASTQAGESSTTNQAKEALENKVEAEKEEIKEEVKQEVQEKKEEVKQELEETKEVVKDTVKQELNKAKEELKNKLKKKKWF